MPRFLARGPGRDPLGVDRLVSDAGTHHYRQFQGGLLSTWKKTDPAPPHLVVGLHGLGSNEGQFETLLPLDLPDGSMYVGLRAPIDYGRDAYSWFDPLLAADRIDYGPAVELIADFVEMIQHRTGVGPEDTTVVGYSQAASLAVALSALRADVADNIALGSAALPPGLLQVGPGRPVRAFIGIGDKDPFVEAGSLSELVDAWDAVDRRLEVRRYDIPHVMSPAMAADITAWIVAGAAGTVETSETTARSMSWSR